MFINYGAQSGRKISTDLQRLVFKMHTLVLLFTLPHNFVSYDTEMEKMHAVLVAENVLMLPRGLLLKSGKGKSGKGFS